MHGAASILHLMYSDMLSLTSKIVRDTAWGYKWNFEWPPAWPGVRPLQTQVFENANNQWLHLVSTEVVQWSTKWRKNEVDLFCSRTIRLLEACIIEVQQDFILVSLYDISDPSISKCKQAPSVPHRRVTKCTGDPKLLEVCKLLLDHIHPPSDVTCSAVR